MITNIAVATTASGISYLAATAITGDTPISLQAAIAVAVGIWGAAWWISNVLRKIDRRFSKFETRQERQWKMTVLLMKHVFKGSEVEALLAECDSDEPPTLQ